VGAVGLRERKKEKTREALARSALRQFARRGFERVTVEDIAGVCDVSPRTFFRYFASKEDVLFADADAQRAHVIDVLGALPPEVPPMEALQAAALDIAANYEGHRDAVMARHRIISGTPSLRSHVAERHQGWESAVLDELRASGRADGVSELTLRLMVAATATAVRVAIEMWLAGDGTCDLAALLISTLDQLRSGLDG
jgi:AcrR family transcriptional regulator